jgi:hypothetical protein
VVVRAPANIAVQMIWLAPRDSNPDTQLQRLQSYH